MRLINGAQRSYTDGADIAPLFNYCHCNFVLARPQPDVERYSEHAVRTTTTCCNICRRVPC
jgi:hypothetical protein